MLALLNALVRYNVHLFQTRRLPSLYQSGIRYIRESDVNDPHVGEFPTKVERWQLADILNRTKRGDCEDLCLYRVGELRAQGQPARFRITSREIAPGKKLLHVTLVHSNGHIEDPSARLGMK